MKRFIIILSIILFQNFIIKAQDQIIIKSKYLSKADTIWVFTPKNYIQQINKNFPIIYLLHGWSGNYKQWNDIIDCQAYANNYQFIIVCPDGLYDSWYINSPVNKNNQYSDFFFKNLMPKILNTYRADKNNTFISGLSMGGHGALYLFEQKPNLFKSAGSTSGVLDLNCCKDKYEIKNTLGLKGKRKKDKLLLNKYSVIGNISKILASEKQIIFSCGTEDPFYQVNNNFRKKCDELKIKAIYISAPGKHDYNFWNFSIKYHFDYFKQISLK